MQIWGSHSETTQACTVGQERPAALSLRPSQTWPWLSVSLALLHPGRILPFSCLKQDPHCSRTDCKVSFSNIAFNGCDVEINLVTVILKLFRDDIWFNLSSLSLYCRCKGRLKNIRLSFPRCMSTISQFQYQPHSTSTGSSMCYTFFMLIVIIPSASIYISMHRYDIYFIFLYLWTVGRATNVDMCSRLSRNVIQSP